VGDARESAQEKFQEGKNFAAEKGDEIEEKFGQIEHGAQEKWGGAKDTVAQAWEDLKASSQGGNESDEGKTRDPEDTFPRGVSDEFRKVQISEEHSGEKEAAKVSEQIYDQPIDIGQEEEKSFVDKIKEGTEETYAKVTQAGEDFVEDIKSCGQKHADASEQSGQLKKDFHDERLGEAF